MKSPELYNLITVIQETLKQIWYQIAYIYQFHHILQNPPVQLSMRPVPK